MTNTNTITKTNAIIPKNIVPKFEIILVDFNRNRVKVD